ncbi:MAG TPA: MBL fold metallo-hydrolase [Fimbriimonas sp.]|nr:MBL fold metallo-hydrolase [Fimbriimonas sp.]
MCPIGRLAINGQGGLFEPANLVCHCFLIETREGLVLVDTGLGTWDTFEPQQRFGKLPAKLFRVEEDPTRTAIHQLKVLGFDPKDVRHIVLTHLDFDHAGGLSDFPWANVHVLDIEHDAAMNPQTLRQRNRYAAAQFEHHPKWALHSVGNGERWFGFDYVRAIPGLGDDLLLIPLIGHTQGHCGVAVREPDGWLLHCGDAIFDHEQLNPVEPDAPIGLRLIERLMTDDRESILSNQSLLRQLALEQQGAVRIVCSHDPKMLEGIPPHVAEQAAYVR